MPSFLVARAFLLLGKQPPQPYPGTADTDDDAEDETDARGSFVQQEPHEGHDYRDEGDVVVDSDVHPEHDSTPRSPSTVRTYIYSPEQDHHRLDVPHWDRDLSGAFDLHNTGLGGDGGNPQSRLRRLRPRTVSSPPLTNLRYGAGNNRFRWDGLTTMRVLAYSNRSIIALHGPIVTCMSQLY